MTRGAEELAAVLDRLVEQQGPVDPSDPLGVGPGGYDASAMLIFTNAGYPASDANCARGIARLAADVGTGIDDILRARKPKIAAALSAGGTFPDLRAERLREIAKAVRDDFGGDLQAALLQKPGEARRVLKRFPTIGDPGADKILLFARIEPVAAVPSAFVDVPLRLGFADKKGSYAADYREAKAVLDRLLPRSFEARQRAYVVLKRHGQEVCKRNGPRCGGCAVAQSCPYAMRGECW